MNTSLVKTLTLRESLQRSLDYLDTLEKREAELYYAVMWDEAHAENEILESRKIEEAKRLDDIEKRIERMASKDDSFYEALKNFAEKKDYYTIDNSNSVFLFPNKGEKSNNNLIFTLASNFIICEKVDLDEGYSASGISKCSTTDTFNAEEGINRAYSRAVQAMKYKKRMRAGEELLTQVPIFEKDAYLGFNLLSGSYRVMNKIDANIYES